MAGYEIPGFVYSRKSHGTIKQFTAVQVTSNGVETASSGDRIDGVAQMEADSDQNESIRIMQTGISFAIAGDDIAEGEEVEVGSDGKFVEQDSGTTVGKALTATDSDDEEFAILLY